MTSERQVSVDRADGGRAFADCSRDSFDRTRANVAGSEQPGMTRLERQGGAPERIPASVKVLGAEGSIREHETLIVESGEARQPL